MPSAPTLAGDAGGSGLTNWHNVVYSADTGFTGGSVGSNIGTTVAGAYTTEQELFQARRITAPSHTFSVTNGAYLVTLKVAELVFNAAGQRVFTITMEGTTVDSNVDIFARAGGSAIAYDKTYAVNVIDCKSLVPLPPAAPGTSGYFCPPHRQDFGPHD